jgi:hypothetical protein
MKQEESTVMAKARKQRDWKTLKSSVVVTDPAMVRAVRKAYDDCKAAGKPPMYGPLPIELGNGKARV